MCFRPESPEFIRTIKMSDSLYNSGSTAYIDLFVQIWEKSFPDSPISIYFTDFQGNETNPVTEYLNTEYDKKIDETKTILKKRMENYGINEIIVLNSKEKGIFEIELNGVDNPERIRKMITEQCEVEFYETYEYAEIFNTMIEAEKFLSETYTFQYPNENEIEETETGILDSVEDEMYTDENPEEKEIEKEHPLTSLLALNVRQDEKGKSVVEKGPVVGYCMIEDTSRVNRMLKFVFNQKYLLFPHDLYFMWTAKPKDESTGLLALVSIKKRNGSTLLNGKQIVNAYAQNGSGNFEIGLDLNTDGAKIFAQLTRDNIGKAIAIVINGKVYSYPIVMSEIAEGKCMITGNFTEDEAKETAILLKSGTLPLDIKILKETVIDTKMK
jgi:SecD/SecF fusion protein